MTIRVNVKFHGTFYPTVHVDSTLLEFTNQATVADLFEMLKDEFGKPFAEQAAKLDYLVVFVNNTEYRQLQGLQTPLSDGDVVTLGHVVAGG
jgi:molybdopterin converting factor small subunit